MPRVAIVTGGTRGIGEAISLALQEAGMTVAAIYAGNEQKAQEGARAGITVNAIAPGYIDTEMVAAVPEDVLGKIIAKIPVGRLGKAEEIARGVVFLCGEDAGFVTGSTLSINGGQHMY